MIAARNAAGALARRRQSVRNKAREHQSGRLRCKDIYCHIITRGWLDCCDGASGFYDLCGWREAEGEACDVDIEIGSADYRGAFL